MPLITSASISKSRSVLLQHIAARNVSANILTYTKTDQEIAVMSDIVSQHYQQSSAKRQDIVKYPSVLDMAIPVQYTTDRKCNSNDTAVGLANQNTSTIYVKYFIFGSTSKITEPLTTIVNVLFNGKDSADTNTNTNGNATVAAPKTKTGSTRKRKQSGGDGKDSDAVSQLNLDTKLNAQTDELILVLPPLSDNMFSDVCTFCSLQWLNHGRFITPYRISELQYNVLRHEKVPPHRKIWDGNERAAIEARHDMTPVTAPKICKYDACSRALGLRPGDLCEILRPSATALQTAYYRVCTILD